VVSSEEYDEGRTFKHLIKNFTCFAWRKSSLISPRGFSSVIFFRFIYTKILNPIDGPTILNLLHDHYIKNLASKTTDVTEPFGFHGNKGKTIWRTKVSNFGNSKYLCLFRLEMRFWKWIFCVEVLRSVWLEKYGLYPKQASKLNGIVHVYYKVLKKYRILY
jgi:hypothetical protein